MDIYRALKALLSELINVAPSLQFTFWMNGISDFPISPSVSYIQSINLSDCSLLESLQASPLIHSHSSPTKGTTSVSECSQIATSFFLHLHFPQICPLQKPKVTVRTEWITSHLWLACLNDFKSPNYLLGPENLTSWYISSQCPHPSPPARLASTPPLAKLFIRWPPVDCLFYQRWESWQYAIVLCS